MMIVSNDRPNLKQHDLIMICHSLTTENVTISDTLLLKAARVPSTVQSRSA